MSDKYQKQSQWLANQKLNHQLDNQSQASFIKRLFHYRKSNPKASFIPYIEDTLEIARQNAIAAYSQDDDDDDFYRIRNKDLFQNPVLGNFHTTTTTTPSPVEKILYYKISSPPNLNVKLTFEFNHNTPASSLLGANLHKLEILPSNYDLLASEILTTQNLPFIHDLLFNKPLPFSNLSPEQKLIFRTEINYITFCLSSCNTPNKFILTHIHDLDISFIKINPNLDYQKIMELKKKFSLVSD